MSATPRKPLDTIISLLMASFVVGIMLWIFGIDPVDLWTDLGGTLARIWDMAAEGLRWAGKYVLLGAIIVVPLWAVLRLFRHFTVRAAPRGEGPDRA